MSWPWVSWGNVDSTLSPWWREEARNHVIQRMKEVPVYMVEGTIFFVLFLFFCFILCTEERSTVGLQQSCFVCQGKKLGDGMVWELPHPMLEWQDGLSFLPLVAKKILVNQMSIWPERNGDVRNWLWEEDSSYLSGQFLALAVTTVPGSVSQSRKKCVLVNWKVEVCYIYWLKLLVLNEKNDKR